jgi:hypothetical protein
MKLDAKKPFRVSSQVWVKREFNPTNKTDLQEYRYFLDNSTWKNGCPCIVEWPFLNVVDMIKHKIVYQHIDKIISTSKSVAA